MSDKPEPTPEQLAASRDPRLAMRRLELHEQYLELLKVAQRIKLAAGGEDDLSGIISKTQSILPGLRAKSGQPIIPRRRKQHPDRIERPFCKVFIDEFGSPSLDSKDSFDAFVLAAVIIPAKTYDRVDADWKRWKSTALGYAGRWIHEPDVRARNGAFARPLAIESLRRKLDSIQFSGVVCVVNRPAYVSAFGMKPLDDSLPNHPYLMSLNFLMERVVMALEDHFDGARGTVIAEARGLKEDALLQHEFTRLLLDGTSYISPAWFRQQLAPGIEFKTKKDDVTGLQLADLLARPCGEKVLNPTSTPERWPECRTKLCCGQETAHSPLGLKIVPWDDRYRDLWKS